MNIVVCIKQVPDPICRLTIASPSRSVKDNGLVYVVNPPDLLALEQGLRLRDRLGQARVTVVTMGLPRAEKALRAALALGADEAIHIYDEALEGSDTYATALVLSRAIRTLPHDLILCGARASDGSTGQVGPSLAELLGLPQVTFVVKLELSADRKLITAQSRLERGDREIVECPLPAVVTVERGADEARYPRLPLRKKAAAAQIPRLGLSALGLTLDAVGLPGSPVQLVSITTPRPKPRKIFTPPSNLSAEDRLRLLMTGGVKEKKGDFLEGTPAEIAGQVVEHLRGEKIV